MKKICLLISIVIIIAFPAIAVRAFEQAVIKSSPVPIQPQTIAQPATPSESTTPIRVVEPFWDETDVSPSTPLLSIKRLFPGGRLLKYNGARVHIDSYSINSKGQVALGPFIWDNNSVTTLPRLPHGGSVSARAINDLKQVVGYVYPTTDDDSAPHAAMWENGRIKNLGAALGRNTESQALGINNRGQAVGFYVGRDGWQRAVLWEKGRMKWLGRLGPEYVSHEAVAINNSGQIIGTASTVDGRRTSFIWEKGVMREIKLPKESNSYVVAINNNGQVVGTFDSARDEHGSTHSLVFLYDTNGFHDLGIEGQVFGINNQGQILGLDNRENWNRPFVWNNGITVFLDELLAKNERFGFAPSLAMNDNGEIVGNNAWLKLPSDIITMIANSKK